MKIKLAFATLIVLVMMFAITAWIYAWRYTYLLWDIRAARLTVKRIDMFRREGLNADQAGAARLVEEISKYHANEGWQRPDLGWDELVGLYRSAAQRELIAVSNGRTGQQLQGETPSTDALSQYYARPETNGNERTQSRPNK